MPLKAILFDFDGVLVDSDEAISRAWTKVLVRHDLKAPPRDEILKGSGLSSTDWARFLMPKGTDETFIAKLSDEFQDSYGKFFFPVLAKLNSHALTTLTALKTHYKLAMITNGNVENMKSRLKNFGLLEFFDDITTDADGRAKPAPDRLWAAATKLEVAHKECLYVGDTQTDVDAAANAGMPSVLIFHARNKHVTGATHHAHGLDELPKIAKEAS